MIETPEGLDDAVRMFKQYCQGEGGFDELDFKEWLIEKWDKTDTKLNDVLYQLKFVDPDAIKIMEITTSSVKDFVEAKKLIIEKEPRLHKNCISLHIGIDANTGKPCWL